VDGRAHRGAELVWAAWTSGRRLVALPDGARPRDVAEGMAAQTALDAIAGPGYGCSLVYQPHDHCLGSIRCAGCNNSFAETAITGW